MRSSKNEFIKPAGRVKLAVLKNYDLRRVPGLCKYGHINIYIDGGAPVVRLGGLAPARPISQLARN